MVLVYLTIHLKQNKFILQYLHINLNAFKIETIRLFDEIIVCENILRMSFLGRKKSKT